MDVHNVPHASQPVGYRGRTVAEIAQRRNEAEGRLLTLCGPGGMGKTRLAAQAAASCAEQFDDGVYVVPLQPRDAPEFIVFAVASGVGFLFSAGVDPQQQLLQYL